MIKAYGVNAVATFFTLRFMDLAKREFKARNNVTFE